MSVLNDCFNTMGLQWTLAGVKRTINENWFQSVYSDNEFDYEIKTQLQVVDLNILTVWFGKFETSFFVGYTTFPQNYTVSPTLDGIVIHYSAFPGGPWNVGLFHMFQGGCYGEGDMVDDTPAKDDSTYGCHISRDTCPHVPREDPIRQVARMRDQLRTYRNIWIVDQPFLPHPYPKVTTAPTLFLLPYRQHCESFQVFSFNTVYHITGIQT
ncbi:hypothetical protein BDQ17DRAFT_1328548 [Cyathus striatus]|nr:hypothetical protein BDQ17DRAFT_1328548 [Cyathus striatus]